MSPHAAPGQGQAAGAAAFLDRHQRPLATAAAVLLLLALHQAWGVVHFPFDSAEYWDLARPGVFFEYASHRGYFFPLLLVPLRRACELAGDPVIVFRIGLSLAYGITLALLVPAVFRRAFGGRVTFVRRLVPVVLLALLFPGVLVYPLSDLPALLLAFAAAGCALAALDRPSGPGRPALFAAAGMLVGAAYNTRPIYALAILALLALAAFGRSGQPAGLASRALAVATVLFGIVAILLPQLAINRATHGVATLAVRPIVNQRSVFASQLVWGLTLQRYETTVAPGAAAPTVYYRDPRGERLYRELVASGDLFSLSHYLRGVAGHPLAFAGLYGRHVANGLDVRDGIVYTRSPSPTRDGLAVLNLAILLAAAWIAWGRRATHSARPGGDAPAAPAWPFVAALLLLPVAAIVPGAIETRFFLPLHLLAYGSIAFWFDRDAAIGLARRRGWFVLGASALVAAAFLAVTHSTMRQLHHAWPEAYRQGTLPP